VTITSIPLQQSTNDIIARLVAMKKAGKKVVEDLIDITDDSRKDEVRLNLALSSKANPDTFIENILSKQTGLRNTLPVEIRVIDNFRSHVWGVKKVLLKWIEYRQECVRATYNKKLMDATNTHHMNEVYLMVFSKDNIKKTSDIARTSKNKDEMIKRFMDTYKISSLQAKTLSNMSYSMFTEDAYQKFKDTKVLTEKQIKEYEEIIADDEAVDKVIVDQLKEIDKLFGGPRKSAIIKAGKPEVKIPDTWHLVGVSRDGYIKKLPIEDAKKNGIGLVGKTSQVVVTAISNRDNLLIFGDDGRLSRVGISSIPNMAYDESGVELARYFTVTGNPVSIINENDVREGIGDIVILTRRGLGKKVKMTEFAKIKDFKDCISLGEDDKLVSAIPAGDEDFIIYTNFGDGIRLNTASIKYQSKNARGLPLISLRSGEEVVGINFMEIGCDKLVYVTSAGRMKITDGKLLPVSDRKSEPMALISLEANEYLVGVSFVSQDDSVVVYRRKSEPVVVPLKDMKVTTRVAKPEKMVKTPSGDSVVAFAVRRANK
jgi:DNA gyrase subunit A